MIKKSVTLCVALLLSAGNAYGATLTFGAYTEGGHLNRVETDGGFGATSASVDDTSGTAIFGGTYQAEVAFDSTSYTAILRAASSMPTNSLSDVNYRGAAYALQTYTYSGTGRTINLDLSLHGIAIDDPASTTDSYVNGKVYVYGNSAAGNIAVIPRLSTDTCPNDVYSWGFASTMCGTNLASTSISGMSISDGEKTLSETLSFNVNNGETFMIYSELRAVSFGGSVDAMNTFGMSFSGVDAASLTAASVSAVPVPSAIWLFASGLLGLVVVARRK